MKEMLIARLRELLPAFITRKEAEEQTMGLIKARTLANLDSKGTGPEKRVKFKRRVAYEKEAFLIWFAKHLVEVADE